MLHPKERVRGMARSRATEKNNGKGGKKGKGAAAPKRAIAPGVVGVEAKVVSYLHPSCFGRPFSLCGLY